MTNDELIEQMSINEGEELYQIETLADGARNTGYKSTYNAIAEIVDNSIEAKAKNVLIIGTQGFVLDRQSIQKFAFLDDGNGMSEDVLAKCLKIGFTTRNKRKGMGRFGVGLPQASYHVSPRVEVYSWQNGVENCKCVYVDWDLVCASEQKRIVGPYNCKIPDGYKQFIHWQTSSKSYDFSEHGTLVVWPKCDRVDHKRWTACSRNIAEDLGRKYRWMLNNDSVNIATIESNEPESYCEILPNDPLFLMKKSLFNVKSTCSDSDSSCQKYDESAGYTESIFEPFTTEDNSTGVVTHPVYYFDKNGNKQQSTVTIRFSIVKAKYYDKQYIASDPGNLNYGKCVKKNTGISIIRQDREIDFGSFDFYDATNNPFHRWWGCEISFTPELDEAFGISNNKQQVSLPKIEDDFLGDYDGNETMWMQLRSIVSETIKKMVKINRERRSKTRSGGNGQTATTATSEIVKGAEENNPDILVPVVVDVNLPEDDIVEAVTRELEEEGYENITSEQIKQYLDSNTRIKYVNYGERNNFLDYENSLGVLKIIVNKDHPFYQQFVQDAYANEDMQTTFELFLAALVKSVYQLKNIHRDAMDKLIDGTNDKLKEYLRQKKD